MPNPPLHPTTSFPPALDQSPLHSGVSPVLLLAGGRGGEGGTRMGQRETQRIDANRRAEFSGCPPFFSLFSFPSRLSPLFHLSPLCLSAVSESVSLISPYLRLFLYLCFCLPVCHSVCLSVSALSVYLYLCLSLSLSKAPGGLFPPSVSQLAPAPLQCPPPMPLGSPDSPSFSPSTHFMGFCVQILSIMA